MENNFLVTVVISVDRDGNVVSDVQTHDNSYSDVAVGLAAVRDEIDRVFVERKKCPFYPKDADAARKKVIRTSVTGRAPSNPNVQDIPRHTEEFLRIRAAFVEQLAPDEHDAQPINPIVQSGD